MQQADGDDFELERLRGRVATLERDLEEAEAEVVWLRNQNRTHHIDWGDAWEGNHEQ